MARERRPKRNEADEKRESFWKGLGRDLIIAVSIVALFLGAMWAYAGIWPPLVVVESSSMQHSDTESMLGVIDTGDMVFQQTASTRASVVTYLEGRASGYMTYGDYGDVIIFHRSGNPTPVIHRAIMYITFHANGTADVPDIGLLPTLEWDAENAAGPTGVPNFLRTLTIRHMGFDRDITLTFTFSSFSFASDRTGYVTMGDHNLLISCGSQRSSCTSGYDTLWMPRLEDIQGRARGEFPWFGLLKLTVQPTDACCPKGWGDPKAPKNSWDSLLVSLLFLIALPFLVEYAGRGWTKYVAPRLPEFRWPWRRRHQDAKTSDPPPDEPPIDDVPIDDSWDP